MNYCFNEPSENENIYLFKNCCRKNYVNPFPPFGNFVHIIQNINKISIFDMSNMKQLSNSLTLCLKIRWLYPKHRNNTHLPQNRRVEFIRIPRKSNLTWCHSIKDKHAIIRTRAWPSQKILDIIDIFFWNRHRLQAISLNLQSRHCLRCTWYDTKLHLMVRLHFWRFGKFEATLHYHYFQVNRYTV